MIGGSGLLGFEMLTQYLAAIEAEVQDQGGKPKLSELVFRLHLSQERDVLGSGS